MADTFNFTAVVRTVAAEMGRTPTPQQVDDLDDALRSLVRRDDAGKFLVTAGEREIPLVSYVRMQAAHFARATTGGSTTATGRSQADRDADGGVLRIGASTQYGRPRGDVFADIARGLQATHDAALAREAAGWPNPWTKGAENRTRQVLIQKVDPAKAAQFRAEAGAS